ncbi:YceI family protein [Limibacter armeniacum]|uniref:YceI family protein n=1 Tax=Limibacter armeniacum TaxID=466084 RepID=UPI002FE50543
MKTTHTIILLLTCMVVGITSFKLYEPKSTYKVDSEASKMEWVGKKVTGQHTGTIKISDGAVEVSDGKLVGGNFTIDMSTINNTDLESADDKAKLEGHLKSDDFFSVEKFPKATFEIEKADEKGGGEYEITGNMTIKGISNKISFPASVTIEDNKLTAAATITVDRTKFDVKYGSGSFFSDLGDKMIYDDFEINLDLVANQ